MTPPANRGLPAIQAAGAVPWRERGRLEVALVHRPRYQDWSFPKGKLDPGESLPAAAVREVAEETATQVVLGAPLPPVRYRTSVGLKQVHYWVARVATDDDDAVLGVRPPVTPAGREEIDEVVWVGTPTARELLTRRSDRALLTAVQRLGARGRLSTRVLAVTRHGQARKRTAWPGDEATRPLTDRGLGQAAALVEVLSAFGIREVVTSPWERCLRTVAPYAVLAGLPPQPLEQLTEQAHSRDPAAATVVFADRITAPRDAVVVTHRPVLADVMKTLQAATRRWTTGQLPDTDPFLHAGEVLVTHVAGGGDAARVVAIELHRPPQPG